MERILYRSLIGHEDFNLGQGKVVEVRGEHTITLRRIELPFIFRTVEEIEELNYELYAHIGLHQIGAVIEYYFDPDSLAVPDDNLVIKPNTIYITEPGRYIKVIGGSGGSGMVYTYVDADYTINYPNEVVLVDSAAGPITITLPAVPVRDNYVGVWDCGDNASLNNIAISRTGNTIHNLAEDALIDIRNGRFDFIYTGITWELSPIAGCSSVFDTIIASASNEYSSIAVSAVDKPETTFRASYPLDLTHGYIRISLTTAPEGADFICDIHMNGVSMFSTLLRIDAGTKTSIISLTPAVLSTLAVPDDAAFEVFVTQVGSTVSGTGIKVAITGIKVP